MFVLWVVPLSAGRPPTPGRAALLVVAFFVAEISPRPSPAGVACDRLLAHGAPFGGGALFLQPWAARGKPHPWCTGCFRVAPSPLQKMLFNCALFALETSGAIAIWYAVLGDSTSLGPSAWLAAGLAIAYTSLLGAVLVRLVIRFASGTTPPMSESFGPEEDRRVCQRELRLVDRLRRRRRLARRVAARPSSSPCCGLLIGRTTARVWAGEPGAGQPFHRNSGSGNRTAGRGRPCLARRAGAFPGALAELRLAEPGYVQDWVLAGDGRWSGARDASGPTRAGGSGAPARRTSGSRR